MTRPFVSIVTPFYNTAPYLRECIESVLNQTYSEWEYILIDNWSTDGSGDIAREYAERDPRIRMVQPGAHLTQIGNYNFALQTISTHARYCKFVEADNWIYPQCVEQMVALAERHPTVGIVSSFHLSGPDVLAQGLEYGTECHSGAQIARSQLLDGKFFLGSPTAVLYRSEVVTASKPFFDENVLHADTEAGYRILKTWDFGFVHQVLAYLRVGNPGIRTRTWSYNPNLLDFLIVLTRFGDHFLSAEEFRKRHHEIWRRYSAFLGSSVWQRREPEFWTYHWNGLSTIGQSLSSTRMAYWAMCAALRHPLATAKAILRGKSHA